MQSDHDWHLAFLPLVEGWAVDLGVTAYREPVEAQVAGTPEAQWEEDRLDRLVLEPTDRNTVALEPGPRPVRTAALVGRNGVSTLLKRGPGGWGPDKGGYIDPLNATSFRSLLWAASA